MAKPRKDPQRAHETVTSAGQLYEATREALTAEPNLLDIVADLEQGRTWMMASPQTQAFFARIIAELKLS